MIKTLFLVLSLVAVTCPAIANDCFEYESANVSIGGVIVRETFPGPPNYESIEKGDRQETIWILKPASPICLKQKDEIDVSETNVKEVQLVLEPEQYVQYRQLVGMKVNVSGSLFHSYSGHHHKRVLLAVSTIENISE